MKQRGLLPDVRTMGKRRRWQRRPSNQSLGVEIFGPLRELEVQMKLDKAMESHFIARVGITRRQGDDLVRVINPMIGPLVEIGRPEFVAQETKGRVRGEPEFVLREELQILRSANVFFRWAGKIWRTNSSFAFITAS